MVEEFGPERRSCYTARMPEDLSIEQLTRLAQQVGFSRLAVTSADPVSDEHARRLSQWLADGMHGRMDYLARNVDLRLDPAKLMDGARSVICLAAGYAARPASESPGYQVARYARGRDYHKRLKKRCHALMDALREIRPEFAGRALVDTAPLLERALAERAGLGVIGRNRCLIAPGQGSWVLLAEIVCNLRLPAGQPAGNGCDACGGCIASCPTGALRSDGRLDARLCISYLTKNASTVPPALRGAMGDRLFGCDSCQAVCPHNQQLPPGDEELAPDAPPLSGATLGDILGWSEDDWDRATRGTTLREGSWHTLRRAAIIVAANTGRTELAAAIRAAAESDPALADVAEWALAKL